MFFNNSQSVMSRLVSIDELSLDSSFMEGSQTSVDEEDEGCPHLPNRILYLDEIDTFNEVQQDEKFDIRPSWSGMKLEITTKAKIDMRVLSQRINYLLDYAAMHAKIMGALPRLLRKNGELLRSWMPDKEVDFIVRTFRRQSLIIESNLIGQGEPSVDLVMDKRLHKAYRMLTLNKCVPLYIHKHPPKLTQYMLAYLNALAEFGTCISVKLEMTAFEAKDKYTRQRGLFDAIRERRFVLKRLRDSVEENFRKYDERFRKKDVQITELREQLESTLSYYETLKQNCFNTSDKILYFSGEASATEQAELSETAKEAQIKYATTIEADLAEERMLRTRKIKLEAQLSMWITKYDTDVGEKQHVLDELNEDFQRENEDLHELECEIIEQAKVYERCQDEQDEEELDAIKAKLFVIASKRAAKILQRYWRLYLVRKKARRVRKTKKVHPKKKK